MAHTNGMDSLLSLFPGVYPINEINLIEHIIDETWFIDPKVVSSQVSNTLGSPKLPVRYSSQNVYSILNGGKKVVRAASLAGNVDYICPTLGTIPQPVEIDYDGNKAVRDMIKTYTGRIVSRGKSNTLPFHTIAHIWGNATHPYFFCMSWNICLIPNHVAWITDKTAVAGTIPYHLQELLKAISWNLYNPNSLIPDPIVTPPSSISLPTPPFPFSSYQSWANNLISAGKVHFI
jgi:hypothetical protein